MRAHLRSLGASVAVVVTALALSGCSAVDDIINGDEPKRDDTSGEVVEASEADVFSLLLGDCVNAADLEEMVETIETIPCGETHDSEAYAVTEMPEGPFPGEDAIGLAADEFCYTEFSTFVGMAYEDSMLEYQLLTPTEAGWEDVDDRQLLCLVVDAEGGVLGTMKGAAR